MIRVQISDEQRYRFRTYREQQPKIFYERIVNDFFNHDYHIHLFLLACSGGSDAKFQLEEAFKKHFFRIRFIKYLSSLIKFCTIDYMRRHQRNDSRFPLIYDRPASEEGESTNLGELLANNQVSPPIEPLISDPAEFESSFTNENLIRTFSMLTSRQRTITTLCYAMCYQDNEIAILLNVSPQAVCKTRNLALQKLKVALSERR